MSNVPPVSSGGWFFTPYKPDPVMSRRFRAVLLLASGGFFALFGLVAVGIAPFGDIGGLVSLPVFGVPILGFAIGAVIDGGAMLKERRISLIGRLAVFLGTAIAVAGWLAIGVLVVKPLVAADADAADATTAASSNADEGVGAAATAMETGPIEIAGDAHIQVLMNGKILLNRQEVSLERLHSSLEAFKAAGAGNTSIYTETDGNKLAPQAESVFAVLLGLELPFTMSGTPDFSGAQ